MKDTIKVSDGYKLSRDIYVEKQSIFSSSFPNRLFGKINQNIIAKLRDIIYLLFREHKKKMMRH